jgi:hypothetical protein
MGCFVRSDRNAVDNLDLPRAGGSQREVVLIMTQDLPRAPGWAALTGPATGVTRGRSCSRGAWKMGHGFRSACAAGICALAAIGVWAGVARADAPLTWTVTNVERVDPSVSVAGEFQGVSCPSVSLCVAVDAAGNIVTSTNPAGGAAAWTSTPTGTNQLSGVSCAPGTTVCVAVGNDTTAGIVVSSTDPTGGAAAWSIVSPTAPMRRVVCPSLSLCVAGDGQDDLNTSTNPTGGPAAWIFTELPYHGAAGGAGDVSCPSTTFCVTVGVGNSIQTSTNPAGGAGAWDEATLPGGLDLTGVSCPSITLCVAVDNPNSLADGDVVSSTDPAGGSAAWTITPVAPYPGNVLTGVSCPSSTFCVASDQNGVLTSTNPTGGAPAWTVTTLSSSNMLTAEITDVSCPSTTLCVAVDGWGDVVVGTPAASQPGGGSGGGGGKTTVDEVRGFKLAARTVRSGKPLTFEVTLKTAARTTIEILRLVPASGHGKRRHKAHYTLVGKLAFNGKVGLNKLLVSKLRGHKLAAAKYLAEVSAGGKPHSIAFTVRG